MCPTSHSPALTPAVEALPVHTLGAATFARSNAPRVRARTGTIWLASFSTKLVASVTQAAATAAAHAVSVAATVHLTGIPHEAREAGTHTLIEARAGPAAVIGTLEEGAAVAVKAILTSAAPVLGGTLCGRHCTDPLQSNGCTQEGGSHHWPHSKHAATGATSFHNM